MEVEGVVYFIQAEMPGHPLKIGFTAGDPKERLAQLQTGSPVPLYLMGVVRGSKRFERWFHRQLAQYKLNGEWFAGAERVRELAARAMWAGCNLEVDDAELAMRLWYRRG